MHQVFYVVSSTFCYRYYVVGFDSFTVEEVSSANSTFEALVFGYLFVFTPFCPVLLSLLIIAVFPVFSEAGVVRRVTSCDFYVSYYRNFADVTEGVEFIPSSAISSLTGKCPFVSFYSMKVSVFYPLFTFVGMPTLCPTPEVHRYPMIDVIKGFLANHPSVVGDPIVNEQKTTQRV